MDNAETAAVAAEKYPDLDIARVMEMIPHRYPMLMIERVQDVVLAKSAVGVKNVSINEPFFQGHFPSRPVMPGVLIIESLAQAAAILSFRTVDARPDDGSVYYLAGVDGARFKRPVQAGDQLHLVVELSRHMRDVYKFKGVAKVDGLLAAECEITCVRRAIA